MLTRILYLLPTHCLPVCKSIELPNTEIIRLRSDYNYNKDILFCIHTKLTSYSIVSNFSNDDIISVMPQFSTQMIWNIAADIALCRLFDMHSVFAECMKHIDKNKFISEYSIIGLCHSINHIPSNQDIRNYCNRDHYLCKMEGDYLAGLPNLDLTPFLNEQYLNMNEGHSLKLLEAVENNVPVSLGGDYLMLRYILDPHIDMTLFDESIKHIREGFDNICCCILAKLAHLDIGEEEPYDDYEMSPLSQRFIYTYLRRN